MLGVCLVVFLHRILDVAQIMMVWPHIGQNYAVARHSVERAVNISNKCGTTILDML